MSKPFVISIPHQLGAAEARRRLEAGIREAKTQYAGKIADVEDRWAGDHMDFAVKAIGQAVTGTLDVHESDVVLTVQLPWALALVAQKLQPILENKGQLLLEKK